MKKGKYLNYKKYLAPLIAVMNKFSFKHKILVSVSVLFLLLIVPAKTTFESYIGEREVYRLQLVSLQYIKKIHDLIYYLELHRGQTNAYLNSNKSFRKSIVSLEETIRKKLIEILQYDHTHFNQLPKDRYFIDAFSKLDLINLNSYTKGIDPKIVFKLHSQIINDLIISVQNIASNHDFISSQNAKVNFIATLLQEKLLLLQENIAQLRGDVVGVFSKQKITDSELDHIFSKYAFIKSLKKNLMDDKILYGTDNFLTTHKLSAELDYQLNHILDIINKNILLEKHLSYDSEKFFKSATDVINLQGKLYSQYVEMYRDLVQEMKRDNEWIFALLLIGFLVIVGVALYIFMSLYFSVTDSLKKLQEANNLVARGETNIHLDVDTKDEIGEALHSFNQMSQKLDQSISFLNGYKMAIDETSIVSKTNTKGIITFVNKQFCEISGYEEKELIGMPHNMVRHPDMPKEVFKELWTTIKNKKIWKGVVKNRKKNGDEYIVDATIIPVIDEKGNIIEYIGLRHDITELEKSKEEIKEQRVDLLTGLYTGVQLQKDLEKMKKPILLYLNIDNFSQINDFYGEKIGDNVLVFVANELKKIFHGQSHKIYRHHNDEFMLLFEESIIPIEESEKLMLDTISAIEKGTELCDEESCVALTLSGGISHYQFDSSHMTLLPLAIKARKVAKKQNKKYLIFNYEMSKEGDYKKNIEWIHKIKDAIEHNRIVPFFQPIKDNKLGVITKYESLVRLIEKDGTVVSPFLFLDIAKKAKLYTKITRIMIDKTLEQLSHTPQYEFSINLAIEDIYDTENRAYIIEKIKNCKHKSNLILEITESEEIEDYEAINLFVDEVKRFGVKVAIDDFGSGYANFKYILELKVDFIKIDGSLIKDIDTNKEAEIVTEAIVAFSKKIGAKTVTEYIHSREVQEKVLSLGADFSQGFYLGEPLSEVQTIQTLTKIED